MYPGLTSSTSSGFQLDQLSDTLSVFPFYLLTTEVPCILETNQEACATSSLEDPQTLISEFLSPLLNPPAMRDKASLAGWNLPDTVSLWPCFKFLWASLMAQQVKNLSAMQEAQVWSLGKEDPLEDNMATSPVFLPGESHGQRIQAGYNPQGCKESDTTEWLSTHTKVPMKASLGKIRDAPRCLPRVLSEFYLQLFVISSPPTFRVETSLQTHLLYEISMDCIVHGVTKSQTRLSDFHFTSLLAKFIE